MSGGSACSIQEGPLLDKVTLKIEENQQHMQQVDSGDHGLGDSGGRGSNMGVGLFCCCLTGFSVMGGSVCD